MLYLYFAHSRCNIFGGDKPMRRWIAVSCGLLFSLPAAAFDMPNHAWRDDALEVRCIGDDEDDAIYRRRLTYAARLLGCEGSTPLDDKMALLPMPIDGLRLRDRSAACLQYVERSWRNMALVNKWTAQANPAFCRHAKGRAKGAR